MNLHLATVYFDMDGGMFVDSLDLFLTCETPIKKLRMNALNENAVDVYDDDSRATCSTLYLAHSKKIKCEITLEEEAGCIVKMYAVNVDDDNSHI